MLNTVIYILDAVNRTEQEPREKEWNPEKSTNYLIKS